MISNLLNWFVWRPERVFAVACVFFLGDVIMRKFGSKLSPILRRPLLAPAVAWAVFAVWEYYCMEMKSNIRVDLFLIYPFLAIVSIVGIAVSLGSVISSFFKK